VVWVVPIILTVGPTRSRDYNRFVFEDATPAFSPEARWTQAKPENHDARPIVIDLIG
jgi:hypothetical protein